MHAVFFIFVAVAFQNVGIRLKQMSEFDGERFRVHLGVVKGHFNVHVTKIAAVVALRQAQCLTVRMPR